MDLFDSNPTVLRHPVWYSSAVQEEVVLPLRAQDYRIDIAHGSDGRWTVTSPGGGVVYRGIGPVSVSDGAGTAG